jgi:adenosylhomocysteine nucleosidase
VQTIGPRAVHLPTLDPETACVIMAGLAGALDPALQVGDVIIDAPRDLLPDDRLPPGCRRGAIYTSPTLITTPQEKAELFMHSRALAVDMENEAVQLAAALANVPFIGIRAISDTADEALDKEMLGLLDDLGRVRLGAVAALLLRRPSKVAELRRLGAKAELAAGNLAAAVVHVHKELAAHLGRR